MVEMRERWWGNEGEMGGKEGEMEENEEEIGEMREKWVEMREKCGNEGEMGNGGK